MRGIWLENRCSSLKTDLEIPKRDSEVLVRVLRSGICNTDLELSNGYYPYTGILGHEFVGRVEDDQASPQMRGKIVTGEINVVCHSCDMCLKGLERHCERRTVLGIVNRSGAFADFLTLPEENLHVVPTTVSVEEACFAEPLAAALEIQEQVNICENQNVLVIGDGKLGLLIAQTLAPTGCNLTVAGKHSNKLEILKKRGISTLNISDGEEISQRYFDLAVECTGNSTGFDSAQKSLRPRGTLVLKSTYANTLTINSAPLVVDELTIVGSRCGPMKKAMEVLSKHTLDLDSLISARFSLDEGLEAFEFAKQKGVLKVQIVVD